jgi:hypothetical protein
MYKQRVDWRYCLALSVFGLLGAVVWIFAVYGVVTWLR